MGANVKQIPGPLGAFFIPAVPQKTAEVCEFLSKQVFDGEYDFPELPTLDQAKHGLTVLDVGAAWGAFTCWAVARWGNPRLQVYAYEPHGKAREFFVENVRFVGPDRGKIGLSERAISEDPNALYACGEDWGAGRTHDQPEGYPVPTLHPRFLPACDVLKCDAEGAEADLIRHYGLTDRTRWLLMEFHDLEKKAAVREWAERAGFRCAREESDRTYGVSLWYR